MDKSRGSANAATEHELLSIATRLQQISAQLVERSRSASISSKHTSVPSGPSGNPITPTAILPEDATSHTSPASEPPPSPNKRGLRPSFYPHAPSIRLDTFHSADQVEFLDALKLKTFEGFYNLSAALFAFALIYLLTRNILEKGWQLHINDFICFEVQRDMGIVATTLGGVLLLCYCIYLLEVLLLKGIISNAVLAGAYIILQLTIMISTCVVIYLTPIGPMSAAMTLLIMCILCLKMHSYVATNYALRCEYLESHPEARPASRKGKDAVKSSSKSVRRRKRSKSSKSSKGEEEETEVEEAEDAIPSPLALKRSTSEIIAYPANISFSDFTYFIVCPSLVYEPYFPRTKRIRKRYVLRKLTEAGLCAAFQYLLFRQFMLPVLVSPVSYLWFDLMKLALPSFLLWLAGFYMLFHCILNIAAELTRFGDRLFFLDWWNSTSLDLFWRKWNVPVHEFCLRHIYVESAVYFHASKGLATFGTFLVSAVFHELIFSVSFKTFRPWFFLGMLLQAPLVVAGRYFRGTRRGNFIMWLSLFLGQPLLEMLYFREFFMKHSNFFCVSE